MGIYKENKKVRKQQNTLSTKKATKNKFKNFLFFLIVFLVESVFPFFFSYFLVLIYEFPPEATILECE